MKARFLRFASTLCAAILSSSVMNGANADTIVLPTDVGSNYRIAFVTAGVYSATSTDINDYNAFVMSQAGGSGIKLALANVGEAPQWFVWGSTASTDAIDNIQSEGVADLPIYNTRGQLVAANWAQLNATLSHPILYDQNGKERNSTTYTGTNGFGISGGGGFCLGCSAIYGGNSDLANNGWTSNWSNTNNQSQLLLSFYAFSSPIAFSLPAPVPVQPSIISQLAGLGLLGLLVWRRKRLFTRVVESRS